MAEPSPKKAKTGEEEKNAEPTPETQEHEENAPEDKRARIKGEVAFHTADTTLNLMPATYGNILTSLSDAGLQYFFAGARASVGVKSGRYMFEAKVLERIDPTDRGGGQHRSQLRVGFSTTGALSILGENDDSFCFDSDGSFVFHKLRKSTTSKRFHRGDVVAVVLNLQKGSQNANTVSLFVNGSRASQPQPLPEKLVGKTLFPTVTFRHATVHVNFGPAPLVDLPFRCRMVSDCSDKDAEVVAKIAPKGGKHEVLYPVALPDEGTFEWLDMFLAENPQYTELSDRKIVEWARQSGMTAKASGSLDKPNMHLGNNSLDDASVRRLLSTIAAIQERDYVVMEVRSNLIKEERATLLNKFPASGFKRVAQVMVGEPSKEFKKRTLDLTLKKKQDAADAHFKMELLTEKRKKAAEKQKRQVERKKAKVVKAQKKANEAVKKKKEEEEKKKVDGDNGEEEKKVEEDEKSASENEESDEEKEDVTMDEEPPKVDLTDEEKKLWFLSKQMPDILPATLSSTFATFSLPAEAEGFDDVRYLWQKGPQCEEYMRSWILNRKLTIPMEGLKPGDWFRQRLGEFKKVLASWTTAQRTYKSQAEAKAAQAKQKALAKEAKKKIAAAKKEAAAAKGEKIEEAEEEKDPDDEDDEKSATVVPITDVFGVENVCDVGQGQPLFQNFEPEDWVLFSLRFELHLLAHSLRLDTKDEDRKGVYVDLIPFYYNKYFQKQFQPKNYGVDSVKDVIGLVRDAVFIEKKASVLLSQLPEEIDSMDVFLKLAEEGRRERERLLVVGEESAKLNFTSTVKAEFEPHKRGSGDWHSRHNAGQQGHYSKPTSGGSGNQGWGQQSWSAGGSHGGSQDKSKTQCFDCNGYGHWANDPACPTPGARKKAQLTTSGSSWGQQSSQHGSGGGGSWGQSAAAKDNSWANAPGSQGASAAANASHTPRAVGVSALKKAIPAPKANPGANGPVGVKPEVAFAAMAANAANASNGKQSWGSGGASAQQAAGGAQTAQQQQGAAKGAWQQQGAWGKGKRA